MKWTGFLLVVYAFLIGAILISQFEPLAVQSYNPTNLLATPVMR